MAYEELVKTLREQCQNMDCGNCNTCVKLKAADAIEELTAIAESYKRSMEAWADTAGKAVEQIPRWVSVTERLPKEDCHVLAYYGFNHVGYLGMMFMQVLDYYARDPEPHFQHEGLNGLTVTHWMPLPEPPKEEA